MDYLVSEGYPGAAEKFAQETNLPTPGDNANIRERVRVRNAIHAGKVDEAVQMVNEIDPQVSTIFFGQDGRHDYSVSFMHHSDPPLWR